MFGFFKKRKKSHNAVDQLIFAIYGNPPPAKRAHVGQSIELANELLLGMVDQSKLSSHAIALNDGPIPYSTHDLALSVALHFFQEPKYIRSLSEAQLLARMKMLEWLDRELVAPMLVQSFESVLYKVYKPRA